MRVFILLSIWLSTNFFCSSLQAATKETILNNQIQKIYVVFMTHLDVGFTDMGNKVIDIYNHEFIPTVLNLSEKLNQAPEKETSQTYPWTTGSWLLWNYLQKSGNKNRERMKQAIQRNDFWWHAMPFTIQTELCDSSLFQTGLALSKQLDQEFGRQTLTAKITDVPGVSRNLIPILRKNGITLLHIGANPGAAVPKIPELFRWKDPASGEIINVIYQNDYGKPMQIPDTPILVNVIFTHDNHGPHTEKEIKDIYESLKQLYPNAQIIPTSFNEIALEITRYEKKLPFITQEIGDTWLYGIASDPKKIAEFRQLMRLHQQWIDEKKLIPQSETDIRFSIPLLLAAEHTWGLDVKTFLKNYDKYEFDKYPEFLQSPVAQLMEQSWKEKRAFVFQAIAQLPDSLQYEAIEALARLKPVKPQLNTGKPLKKNQKINTRFFQFSIDPQFGFINYLKEKQNQKEWGNPLNPWGEFIFQTYSEQTIKTFISQYCPPNPEWWMWADYGKPELEQTSARDTTEKYKVQTIRMQKKKETVTIAVHLTSSRSLYGSPQNVFIEYCFPEDKPEIEITINWFNKEKNRIPEAVWFSFLPLLNPDSEIEIDKMGRYINVKDVIYNGARTIQSLTKDLCIHSGKDKFSIESLDAPLVVFNERSICSFNNQLPDPQKGIHFCLLNNLWGTNYPQWFGEDMKFRFIIKF